jgi:hypothetical protein
MVSSSQHLTEKTSGLMGQIESLPASAYYWGAIGSIGVSALLMLLGRKNLAVFVGLWPPTIALLGLFNKQLHPSRDLREAGNITEEEGEAERQEGKVQEVVGKVKDAARDVKDAVKDAVKD